jgi:hypothetical protein
MRLIAVAMIRRFLMMYCPSRVGTNGACQVADGRRMSGSIVENI